MLAMCRYCGGLRMHSWVTCILRYCRSKTVKVFLCYILENVGTMGFCRVIL